MTWRRRSCLAGGALDRERRRPVPSMEVVFG